jgi:hypothetical protein
MGVSTAAADDSGPAFVPARWPGWPSAGVGAGAAEAAIGAISVTIITILRVRRNPVAMVCSSVW